MRNTLSMSNLPSKISEKIKALVDAIGSQDALARHAGVSQGIVSRWMAGTAAPSKKTRMRLSAALNVPYQVLLDDTAPLGEELIRAIEQKAILDMRLGAADERNDVTAKPAASGKGGRKQSEAEACLGALAENHLKLLRDVSEHSFGKLILKPSFVEESLRLFVEMAKNLKPAAGVSVLHERIHEIARLLQSLHVEMAARPAGESTAAALAVTQNAQGAQIQELLKRLEKMETSSGDAAVAAARRKR